MRGEPEFAPTDWRAIHAAFDQLEAAGKQAASRPLGFVPMSVMFEHDVVLPTLPLPTIPRKTNGFGGRSRTFRRSAYSPAEPSSTKPPLGERLALVDSVHDEMMEEVDIPTRLFFKWVETTGQDGKTYREREYIYDEAEIESIRQKERDAIAKVARVVRINIYESDPRMKGFPGAKRLEGAEDTYANLNNLQASRNPDSKDPLVQAVVAELLSRLSETPEEKERRQENQTRFGSTPNWQEAYNPFWNR